MLITVDKIKFRGEDYILVEGAITKPETFATGKCGFAHLRDDNSIIRYGTIIGSKDDIIFLGKDNVEVGVVNFLDGIMGDTWPEEIQQIWDEEL